MPVIKQFQSIAEIPSDFVSMSPFQTPWYLEVYIKNFCTIENIFLLGFFENETLIGYGAFERVDEKAFFLGMKHVLNNQEVTDYGDIVLNQLMQNFHEEIWKEIRKFLFRHGIRALQLDFVRDDSQTFALFKDFASEQSIAPYIMLPKTWDEYLELLDRVDRKELKRKLRRLETIPYEYQSIDPPVGEAGKSIQGDFDEFVRLHKSSSGEKDEFMTDGMKRFFWELISVKKIGWKTNLGFLQIEGKKSSSILSFENDTSILGYNSGYDPSFNYYSVGLLLHAIKIREAIEKGMNVYDFLRGTERYKYDLGGIDRKLYKIMITL